MDETLASKRASLTGLDYAFIVYNATGKNWFVVSGSRAIGGVKSVFYEKLHRFGAVGDDPQP